MVLTTLVVSGCDDSTDARMDAAVPVADPVLAGDTTAPLDRFGAAVAFDGESLLVGVPNDDTVAGRDAGSVTLFRREAGVWMMTGELLAPDARPQDNFGAALAVAGDVLVVGAPDVDLGLVRDAGAVYVFSRGPEGWDEGARIIAPEPIAEDRFGSAVALSNGLLAIGAAERDAVGLDSGGLYVFEQTSSGWQPLPSALTRSR